ncbi:MAG: two-component system response regulator KdpE [Betaproteobacteria bacterium]|nr:two-component system response regulator KdpE [Betaproteobacteria bacterium]MDE2123077.1 two-component system response regulator KdpE [Betaproteobacteria bacterium]MDE2186021.1 two-component system response regulator KdpE [Betaproteobacteria bacterium]MDE2325801.1 two-component system response regulator KdpE [Betaproteobacteria bacterium]
MTTPASLILVIEDEAEIRRFVRAALEAEGYRVCESATMARGLIDAGTRKPDLVILDLGLPDGDGIDFIRDFRGWSGAPLIVLSARSAEAAKVTALDQGADDYLGKPFGVAELLARVRAALRRPSAGNTAPGEPLRFGRVELDMVRRLVSRDGDDLRLTVMEYRLLCALASRPGLVLTHRQLLREVWGPGYVEHGHYLRIYMGRLRHKLEDEPARPRHLLTEVGVGYRFMAD